MTKVKSPLALSAQQGQNGSEREGTDGKSGVLKSEKAKIKQYSVHLKESTHRNVKIALLMAGGKKDFSSLVEELLTQYLNSQKINIKDLEVISDGRI